MTRLLPLLIAFCGLTSCGSLTNGLYTSVKINVPKGTRVTYIDEYGETIAAAPDCRNDVYIEAKRSKTNHVEVTLKNDTVERTIFIKPLQSWFYYASIYPFYGLGFFSDYKNPNPFMYPRKVYADLSKTSVKGYWVRKPFEKSSFSFFLSPPLTNVFVFNLNNLNSAGSPFGIAGGVSYHYRSKRFLNLETGVATVGRKTLLHRTSYYNVQEEWTPYPHEHKSGWYLNFRSHHVLGRFDFGYGLAAGERLGTRFYEQYNATTDDADSFTYHSNVFSIGGTFVANFRLTNLMYAGINYQPQLMSVDKDVKFNYAHLVTFGLSWRFPIRQDYVHLSCAQKP